ncbi:hypothetical protein Tco_0158228 [Tanacetum coccineum]
MASSITRFDIEKFDGKNDFGLWQIKMHILMVQQGCDAALKTLPADIEEGEKAALMKKAYSTLILCLGDRVLREVTKETTAAGIWTKLTSLSMTKSLENRLYLKKKLYTYYMSQGTKLGDHIDEFNKLILDLANIDIDIEDEDQALMLLTSLPSYYENFMETLLYGRESLTMEDVLATLNSRSDHSEDHLKRDCPKKKSSGFVKKGKRDQDSDSFDDEGNTYFGEALVVVGNDEMTELVMDSGGSYHMTHRRDFLYDFKVVDGGSVRLGDNRTCTIKRTGKVKIQLHNGSRFILEDVMYVPGLRRSFISLGTFEKEGYTVKMQMGRIKIDKRVWFEVKLQGAQGNREAEEQEKVHLGIKVGANITVIGVPGQEDAEGNVAEKKKVKESMEANLGKLLKYNAWSTRNIRMDVVFDAAFGGVGDKEFVVGEGVVVTSSSLDMLTNSCLGGIMVSLIFLEGLDEEALVEFMIE